MKNYILNALQGYNELTSEEIMALNENNIKNSEFKLNLLKDKTKGAKISDSKFYVANNNVVVKFQYDETCNKLVVCPSEDISGFAIKELNGLNVQKIEFYCNSSFNQLQEDLKANGFLQELVRKDRFLNETYEDEVVLSNLREGM